MARRGGGCLTALAVALSVAFVALGGGLLYLVATNQLPSLGDVVAEVSAPPLEPAEFSEYTWDELAQVAALIAEQPSDEQGESVAAEWGIEVGDTRPLPLSDGRQATLTVVGIRRDQRSDGTGIAGLTLMASPIAQRPMNDTSTNAGGWESCALRSWLAEQGPSLLPADLADNIVSVRKMTNNVGVTTDPASVSETDDALWLFSLSEVCGPVDVYVADYGDQVRARTYYKDYASYDAILSLEGEQYPYFAEAGVTCRSDASGTLALTYGGEPTTWWYRTSQILPFDDDENFYFYQVMESGYPSMFASAETPSGVTVGLCL